MDITLTDGSVLAPVFHSVSKKENSDLYVKSNERVRNPTEHVQSVIRSSCSCCNDIMWLC